MDQVRPATGKVYDLGDDVHRIIAPNPSPMTYWGTNTYLIGTRGLALIDPGPDSDAHLSAILNGLRPGQHISHIFVTHSHVDHSPLSRRLAQQTGARIYAFGPSGSGRSEIMQKLAKAGIEDAGEGVDPDFETDENLQDKQVLKGDGWTLTALWTPGHLGNHLCFQMGDVIFCGDLVMGWSSSLVSPPDGDLTDFMASCKRLRKLGARVFHAGHGAPIDTPDERLDWLIAHREGREASILAQLAKAPVDATTLARALYTDTPGKQMRAASRNVLAHLIDLFGRAVVKPVGELHETAVFELV